MKKSRFTKLVVSIVLVAVLTGVLIFFSAMAAIGLEYLFVKWDIDNPHVDNHFSEWEPVSIEGCSDFLIPNEWSVIENGEIYSILDSSNQVWAYGTFFGTEHDRFQSYKDFVEKISSTQPIKTELEPFPPCPMMDGSGIVRLTVHYESTSTVYYCIQLFIDVPSEFVLFVPSDLDADMDQYDIAEALVYSYAFQVAD